MTDTIVNPLTGYTITFLEASEELFRFKEVALPSTYGPALHVHPLQEERFEVIRGSVEFVMGTRKIVCHPGESVVVPAGVTHTFKNAADGESEMFGEYRPGLPEHSRRFFEVYFGLARAGLTDLKGLPSIWQIAVEMPTMSDHVRLASPPWAVQRLVLAVLRPIARLRGYRPFELEPPSAFEMLPDPRSVDVVELDGQSRPLQVRDVEQRGPKHKIVASILPASGDSHWFDDYDVSRATGPVRERQGQRRVAPASWIRLWRTARC